MTDNLEELERLLAKATPGEWLFKHDDLCATDRIDGDDLVIAGFGRSAGLRSSEYSILRGGKQRQELEANAALIVALRNAAPSLIATAREVEGLRAEVARLTEELRKANEPHWFYAEDNEERCLFSPDEVIDWLDFEAGEYVTEVTTARPCKSIWCAVRVTDDEDADERFTFTEHATELEARAALEGKGG